jgi:hypothetical protein
MNNNREIFGADEIGSNHFETNASEQTIKPLGTFAGTIYKVLYRSNGKLIPSDTSDQLIFDGRI